MLKLWTSECPRGSKEISFMSIKYYYLDTLLGYVHEVDMSYIICGKVVKKEKMY